MSYRVDKFKTQDWYDIDPREENRADLEACKKELIFSEIYTKGMPFFTLRYNDEIIVIYGFMYGGAGTYYPTVISGKNIKRHIIKVTKLFYDYFATYVPKDCRRLEAFCDIMDAGAIRLAKHFGFDIVGIRHMGSPEGHDQAIMERITLHEAGRQR